MLLTRRLARKLSDYDDPRSFGSRLRARRVKPLLRLIESAYLEHGHVDIVDIGGTEEYWRVLPEGALTAYDVRVTIVNIRGPVSHKGSDRFRFVDGDGCDLGQLADGSFHIAHSNSVIEHVGDWRRMQMFAREVARLSPRYFVQTPNYWFFVEPHCMTPFFHWLPEPTRVFLISRFELGNWRRGESVAESVRIVESARLLSKRMMSALFPDAAILTEQFVLMSKSLIALKG